MKVELTYLERGAVANVFRIRAAKQRALAEQRRMSSTKLELLEEATYWESKAQELDDATEPTAISETEPIKANPRIDIDNVDGPKKEKEA